MGCQKEQTIIPYLEPFIVYGVLFLPGLAGGEALPEKILFSTSRELFQLVGYTMPSCFLIWYLLYLRGDTLLTSFFKKQAKTEAGTLVSLALALPGLLATGLGISFISPLFSTVPIGPVIEAPQGAIPWLVMALSCAGTGYLEESFFRYYLLTRFAALPRAPIPGIAVSVLLFSLCHIYEGPWGILNALLAGVIMSLIFLRYGSLHGIAWAHGLYNIFVYTFGV